MAYWLNHQTPKPEVGCSIPTGAELFPAVFNGKNPAVAQLFLPDRTEKMFT